MSFNPPALVDVVESPEEAASLAVAPLIVRSTLADALPGLGPVTVERIGEGHSNATFSVRRGDARWILRRPPRPPYEPRAHDVLREYRMLSALADSVVPVPETILACDDPGPIGAPFYLMNAVDGIVIRERVPSRYAEAGDGDALADELVDGLVALHGVDWDAVGLQDLAPHAGYLDRQLRQLGGQLRRTGPRRLDALYETEALLRRRIPASQATTIVHGDYKIDNVMWAPEGPPRLVAIVDWEMATLGDPLADLGFLTAVWSESGDPDGLLLGLAPAIDAGARLPATDRLITRYARRSGRTVEDLGWYQTLGIWKLTILLEASYGRHLAGIANDSFFERLDEGLPRLAQYALELARDL
jgi:aminoglycoside phosphotransferase (APT) family kinase protein